MSSFYLPNIGAGFFPNNTGGGNFRVAGIRSPDTGFVYSNMPSYQLSEGGFGGGFGGPMGQPIPNSLINDMGDLIDQIGDVDTSGFNDLAQQGVDAFGDITPDTDFAGMFDRLYGDATTQLESGRSRLDSAQRRGRARTDRLLGQQREMGREAIEDVSGRVDASIARMEQVVNDFADNTALSVAAVGEGRIRNANSQALQTEQDLINQGVPAAQAASIANNIKLDASRAIGNNAAQVYTRRDETLATLGSRVADVMRSGAQIVAGTRANVMGNLTSLGQAAISQDTQFAGQVAQFESSTFASLNQLRSAGLYGTNQANQIKSNNVRFLLEHQRASMDSALNHQLRAQQLQLQGFGDLANLHMTNYFS